MIGIYAEAFSGQAARWLARYRWRKPTFICVLSFTETALIPKISAAGQSPQDRRRTAAAEGQFIASDYRLDYRLEGGWLNGCGSGCFLPPLAAGVSPAVITKAVLRSLKIPFQILCTGLPTALLAPHINLPQISARDLRSANAMRVVEAELLFRAGLLWGESLACLSSYVAIGECVVGGTTTAQAVLTGLGYNVTDQMGSSHLDGNHRQKQAVVETGISALRQRYASPLPIEVVAALGDPMQIVVAGIALAASRRSGVLLAGGSQMLAVYALMKALARQYLLDWNKQQVVIGTTRWLIEDRSANTIAIANQLGSPYLATKLSFQSSPYMQLRAYERGFIKEGTGAGGCAIISSLYADWNNDQLRHAVERELPFAY